MNSVSDIFQSRIKKEAALITRPDPVVYDKRHAGRRSALTQQQLYRYRRTGFLFLARFFPSEDVAKLVEETRRLTQDDALRTREEVITESNSNAVRSVFRVHRLSAVFERLMSDARLVHIGRQILGGGIYIHQSRLNLNPGLTSTKKSLLKSVSWRMSVF